MPGANGVHSGDLYVGLHFRKHEFLSNAANTTSSSLFSIHVSFPQRLRRDFVCLSQPWQKEDRKLKFSWPALYRRDRSASKGPLSIPSAVLGAGSWSIKCSWDCYVVVPSKLSQNKGFCYVISRTYDRDENNRSKRKSSKRFERIFLP